MKLLALYEADASTGKFDKVDVAYPMLHQQFYEHAETFIEANKDRPFFVELALSAPHLPECPHPPFVGKSGRGLGDGCPGRDEAAVRQSGENIRASQCAASPVCCEEKELFSQINQDRPVTDERTTFAARAAV